MKDVCGVRIYYFLFLISVLFLPDAFSQKLYPVVVKKLEGKIYSKEEYSIIKRGKEKDKRHGAYVYSKYKKEIEGTYYFGSKDGEWKHDQSPDKYSEYYTKGHLDSVKGIKDGFEVLVYFDKRGDTLFLTKDELNPLWLIDNSIKQDSMVYQTNGIALRQNGDTTIYYHNIDKSTIGIVINGKRTGKWRINTSAIKATL